VANKKEVSPELVLTYKEYKTGGEAIDPGDQWTDHEPEYIHWTAENVYVDEPGKKAREKTKVWYTEVLKPNFEVKKGDTLWLVIVRYTTGCTFGSTHGAWHIEGAFQHQGQAEKVKKAILDDWDAYRNRSFKEKQKGTFKDKYVSPHGYKVWMGYFESLEEVDVQSFVVE
jgi:hypothetical protein